MVNIPGRRMRAGDADRDIALAVLQDAHVAGRLSIEELLERQEQVLKVVHTDEIPPLVEDLPEWQARGGSLARAASGVPAVAGDPGAWGVTIMTGKDVDLPAGTGGVRDVTVMGGNNYRLGDVLRPGAVVTVEVYAVMGGHTLYVPEGVRVLDESTAVMGGNDVKRAARGDGSNGTLVLRGFSLMGGNVVKLDDGRRRR